MNNLNLPFPFPPLAPPGPAKTSSIEDLFLNNHLSMLNAALDFSRPPNSAQQNQLLGQIPRKKRRKEHIGSGFGGLMGQNMAFFGQNLPNFPVGPPQPNPNGVGQQVPLSLLQSHQHEQQQHQDYRQNPKMDENVFHLRWPTHFKEVWTSFESLLESGTFVDVTLMCDPDEPEQKDDKIEKVDEKSDKIDDKIDVDEKDEKEPVEKSDENECEVPEGVKIEDENVKVQFKSLRAHKLVLSAASDFFHMVLEESPCKHSVIILKDFKFGEISTILEFIYKGEISIEKEKIEGVLRAAEILQIRGLQEYINKSGQMNWDSMKKSSNTSTCEVNSPEKFSNLSSKVEKCSKGEDFEDEDQDLRSPRGPQHEDQLIDEADNEADDDDLDVQERKRKKSPKLLNLARNKRFSSKTEDFDDDDEDEEYSEVEMNSERLRNGPLSNSNSNNSMPRRKQARPRRRSGDFVAQDLRKNGLTNSPQSPQTHDNDSLEDQILDYTKPSEFNKKSTEMFKGGNPRQPNQNNNWQYFGPERSNLGRRSPSPSLLRRRRKSHSTSPAKNEAGDSSENEVPLSLSSPMSSISPMDLKHPALTLQTPNHGEFHQLLLNDIQMQIKHQHQQHQHQQHQVNQQQHHQQNFPPSPNSFFMAAAANFQQQSKNGVKNPKNRGDSPIGVQDRSVFSPGFGQQPAGGGGSHGQGHGQGQGHGHGPGGASGNGNGGGKEMWPLPLGPPPIFGRHRAQHSAPRGGPPRAWSNTDLTEALHNVWNKKMTTSQASRIFGIPYNSLLMYVRGKYGKSLKLDQLKKGLDLAALANSNKNSQQNNQNNLQQSPNNNNSSIDLNHHHRKNTSPPSPPSPSSNNSRNNSPASSNQSQNQNQNRMNGNSGLSLMNNFPKSKGGSSKSSPNPNNLNLPLGLPSGLGDFNPLFSAAGFFSGPPQFPFGSQFHHASANQPTGGLNLSEKNNEK